MKFFFNPVDPPAETTVQAGPGRFLMLLQEVIVS
jgi:hypothetical protein